MNLIDVTAYMVAAARTGKSFFFTRWIVSYLLPETELRIYTNLPLKVDVIAEHCERKYGMPQTVVRERLHVIPREVELTWKNREPIPWESLPQEMRDSFTSHNKRDRKGEDKFLYPGPWHYFFGKPLEKSIVIIDEIHNFCGCDTPKPIAEAWRRWLGELGHEKGIFRCMTQDAQKLADCIKSEGASVYRLENTSFTNDPIFKIQIYDWQMLASAFLCLPYRQCVICQEEKKDPLNPRVKKVEGVLSYMMGPPYFDMYDSFNKPIEGAQKADEQKAPFETVWQELRRKHGAVKGRLLLLAWFMEKNARQLIPRLALAILILHVVYNLSDIMQSFVSKAREAIHTSFHATKPGKVPAAQNPAPAPVGPRTVKPSPTAELGIVAITKTAVITADGRIYRIGDRIGERRLIIVDYEHRRIKLDEDVIALDL